MFRYFRGSLVLSAVGVLLGAAIGHRSTGSIVGAMDAAFVVTALGLLEVSLSFDNAIVNATVLAGMSPRWRRRFVTWGIVIAVFGVRLVFPLLLVASAARVGPFEAVRLAATEPEAYARLSTGAHVRVSAFGGVFLALAGLRHFIDRDKETFWIRAVEAPLAKLGRVEAIRIALVLLVLYGVSLRLPPHQRVAFLVAGIIGLVAYIAVDGLGAVLRVDPGAVRSGLASFLYLELLDASFSFDGVIGAFALSTNLFVIALGLGIGALFVRSLTLMLVERGTLARYRYLEHGAFYAILALACIMFLETFVDVPEVLTGLIGAGFIAVALWSSLRHDGRAAAKG